MEKSDKFTWEFGQPVHREDKEKFVVLETGKSWEGECLDEQVDRICGKTTVIEYLQKLPAKLKFGDDIARLEILKGVPGSMVWQVRYFVRENIKRLNFTKHTVLYENAPDLRLALHMMLEEVNKKYKDNILADKDTVPDDLAGKEMTVSELLSILPPKIQYWPTETMTLRISKGYSNKIWYAGYYTYIDAPGGDFQITYVEKVTESDLKVTLFKLIEKIQKYIIKDESN